MPIGIVAYAFTLSRDNLCRNSCICVLYSIFFEIFVSEIIIISFVQQIVVIVQSVCLSPSLRNNMFVQQGEAIWL